MERTELVERLIALLLGVMPEYRQEAAGVADEPDARRYLLRCLMNVWDPRFPLPEEYFSLEAKLLTAETEEKRPVDAASLAEAEPGIALWQGDITRLAADAIVVGAGAGLSTAAGFPKKRLFYTQGAARRVLFLELGVGANTPGIIKYPFWRMTAANKNACYVAINPVEQLVPDAIAARALTLACGIDAVV